MPVVDLNGDGLPEYFITMMERSTGSRPAAITGANGADTDIRWHLRQSIADIVSSPVRYRSNYPSNEELPDFLEHNDMLFVSQRLRLEIEPWLRDYEFLCAEIEHSQTNAYDSIGGGEVVAGYWWLNSWRLLDIVDRERSEFTKVVRPSSERLSDTPVEIHQWRRLFVRPASLDGEHFFGVRYVMGARRYISPQLHAHLQGKGFRMRFGVHALGSVHGGQSAAVEKLNAST